MVSKPGNDSDNDSDSDDESDDEDDNEDGERSAQEQGQIVTSHYTLSALWYLEEYRLTALFEGC